MKSNPWMYVLIFVCLIFNGKLAAQSSNFNSVVPSSTKAVLQVDVPYPTSDKPQSKLWYMKGGWWAILPTSSGPSLWKRGKSRWVERKKVGKSLANIPGRADVWAMENVITAVSVDPQKLVVFRLTRRRNFMWNKWDTEI